MSQVREMQCIPQAVPRDLGERIIPEYDQIFKPPPLIHRPKGKKYGRSFLQAHYASEWFKYNRNMKKANQWLEYSLEESPQQDGETKRDWLRRICSMKIAENDVMEPLIFYGVSMTWQVEDIVTHLIEKIDQSRKKRNRKNRQARENEEMEEENHVRDMALVPTGLEEESDDEKLVMAELNADVHTVRGKIFGEIKHLRKFVPNKRRFDGYTSKPDNVRMHMLAEYYREKRRGE